MADRWIIIPNWDKFQHYGYHQRPPWIKVYTALNSDPKWEALTLGQKGLLVVIWLEYARSSRELTLKAVAKQAGRSHKAGAIKALETAGFIRLASRPEVEVDKEPPYPHSEGRAKPSPNGAVCPECGIVLTPPLTLTEHLHLQH